MSVQVLRGGCNQQHPSWFVQSRPNGLSNYLLLILRSHGEFTVDTVNHYSMEPGSAIIFAPEVPYTYHNPNGDYVDDWLHFNFDQGQAISSLLPLNKPFRIEDFETCSTLIRQLLWENYYTVQRFAGENITSLYRVLENHMIAACQMQEHIQDGNPYNQLLQEMRFMIENDLTVHHTIEGCAQQLGLSESYFQALYTRQFGISFQKDLIQMRVNTAKFLLETTDLSMAQIAEMCGYNNEVHFYRQFKKVAGLTPAKYRKKQYAIPHW